MCWNSGPSHSRSGHIYERDSSYLQREKITSAALVCLPKFGNRSEWESSDTSDQLKKMLGDPMKIHLNENVETFAICTTRSFPFAWRDKVKANFDQMPRQGIVKPLGDVPTRWCHPLVVVPKPRGAYVFVWTAHVSTNSVVAQFIL